MAGAWAVAPHLPGADAEPLFDTHSGRGGRHRDRQPARRHPIAHRQPGRDRDVHGDGDRAVVLADLGAAPLRRQPLGRRRERGRGRRRHVAGAVGRGRARTTRCSSSSALDGPLAPRGARTGLGAAIRRRSAWRTSPTRRRCQDRRRPRRGRHVPDAVGDAPLHRRRAGRGHVRRSARRDVPRAPRRPSAGDRRDRGRGHGRRDDELRARW